MRRAQACGRRPKPVEKSCDCTSNSQSHRSVARGDGSGLVVTQRDALSTDILLWTVPTFVLNLVLTHGDVIEAAGVAAIVTAVAVPLERRLARD